MNILIINTNRSSLPVPVMPIGACMVAEAAEMAGHNVRVLDLIFERDPLRALELELTRTSPDIAGLSIRNIDNNDMQTPVAFFKDLIPLVDAIHRISKATIVLGGSAVNLMPEELLFYTEADWAVLGDGEVVFPKLLENLTNGETPEHIPGIAWIEDNVFRINSCPSSRISNGCLTPNFHRWIDVYAYQLRLSTVPIQTKLGCHFKCVYCTYRKIEGDNYRLFDSESVVDTVKRLMSRGVHDFEFVDNVFNSPYDHAMSICEGLARIGHGIRLQSLMLNPLFIDDDLITAMERAGFTGIGITAESASDNVLKGLRKGFTAEDVCKAAHVIKHHKLPCLWLFMLGGPGETKATVRETLGFAENFIRPIDVAFFNIGIRIYPGTELESIARKQGLLSLSPREMLEPVFYVSPEIEFDWLVKQTKNSVNTHMNFINSDSISLPFLPTINRLGYRLGIRPPLWRHTRFVRRGLRVIGIDS